MTEQTLITITPDELIEQAHLAAAEADAEKARELEARQAEQQRETEAKQRERADQLRALIRETSGFDMDIQPDDLEKGHEWRIHPEVTLNAVRLVETNGKPKTQVARELGISESALYRWLKDYGTAQAQPAASNGQSMKDLEAELKRLRCENDVLRQEHDILKRLSAFAARNDGVLPDDRRASGQVCRGNHVPCLGCLNQRVLRLAHTGTEPARARRRRSAG
jgi:transposase